ncbi:conserved domain protein [Finegoldia magna SY403409CC001050417]|uniref:hypothetical protein n=1 Tax=Finegoldia magna TaxID=1260 RepID=UPI00021A397B|nr:hypothetical protein [Finegoldia magna]EGS35095.1 conserved domain protein [Finegoldia magna SY403409CC001050417]
MNGKATQADELTINQPAIQVPVANKEALTKEEKQAVKDAIKAANPGLGLTDDDITVDDKGNVTVAKDGKEGKLTADKVVEAKAPAEELTINQPAIQVPVANKEALTKEEKQAVKEAIKAANPD